MGNIELLERDLASSGHRLTAPRRALLETMLGLGSHFTAEDLAAATPGVGRATVFRTLRLLQDIDVVCQVLLDDGTPAYRLGGGGHHHHIVCSVCGTVSDFAQCDIDGLLAELARRTGYEVEAHRLEVYGRCSRCQSESLG